MQKNLALLFLAVLTLASCQRSSNFDTPREFFEKNKIGSSPDYSVMKNGNDHVISVHGFVDDLTTCQEISAMLNKTPKGVYSCVPLNH